MRVSECECVCARRDLALGDGLEIRRELRHLERLLERREEEEEDGLRAEPRGWECVVGAQGVVVVSQREAI